MKVKINENTFEEIINGLKDFCSKDDARPGLRYIQLRINGNEVKATATDGFTLAMMTCQCESEDEFEVLIKPIKFKAKKESTQNVEIELTNDEGGVVAAVKIATKEGQKILTFSQAYEFPKTLDNVFSNAEKEQKEITHVITGQMARLFRAMGSITDGRAIATISIGTNGEILIRPRNKSLNYKQLALTIRNID